MKMLSWKLFLIYIVNGILGLTGAGAKTSLRLRPASQHYSIAEHFIFFFLIPLKNQQQISTVPLGSLNNKD
jgi:hypothetical protein